MYTKEIDKLKRCAAEMANIMGMEKLSPKELSELYDYLITLPQSDGGKEILGAFELGMVTKAEVINFLQAHTCTTILHKNSCDMPDILWEDTDMFEKFKLAVFATLK